MAPDTSEGGAFPANFRVGDWLVEPSLDRISRNGTTLRLRPQLTNLLVFLARRAGRTVAKEEILASVWDGQFVAESGMTRCIAEIRQALEDDARVPTVIQTVPKRGYRLVAPVVFLGPQAGVEAGAASDSRQPVGGGTDEVSQPASPPVIGALEHAITARRTTSGSAGWTMRTTILAVLLATGLALTTGEGSRTPALGERESVLLADVTNTTGDSAFDQTLRLALAVQLGQAPSLNILSTGHVRAALTLMGRSAEEPLVGPVALEVCRREAAALLLQGSIARFGSHYALGLEAIACASGESVARELQDVEGKDRVLAALGNVATRLRRKLGESSASLRKYDVPVVQATTPSLDALKALSLGDLSRDRGLFAEALTCYRRATELDPQFAVAWARRGAAAHNLGHAVNEERFGPVDEPTVAFTRAYTLRERVSEPERFYILSHYYRFVEGDPFKAVEIYKMWKRLYPGSVVPSTNLASIYVTTLGEYEAALAEAREAVRLAPYSAIARRSLIVACLGTNRLAEARQTLRESLARGDPGASYVDLSFQMAYADNDEAAMHGQARSVSNSPSAAIVFAQHRALAAASLGRLGESRRLWAEAAYAAAEAGTAMQQATIRVTEAGTEALLGDPRAAVRAADAALAIDRHPGTLITAAIAHALAGTPAHAGRLIEEASRRTDAGICSRFAWGPVARALVEARTGRPEQALVTLRQAAPFERGRDFGLGPMCVRGQIELLAGMSREAASTFQSVIDLARVAPTSSWVAFARVGVARALQAAGQTAASRTAYEAAIDRLKHADPDAALLVAARRERASLPEPSQVHGNPPAPPASAR